MMTAAMTITVTAKMINVKTINATTTANYSKIPYNLITNKI